MKEIFDIYEGNFEDYNRNKFFLTLMHLSSESPLLFFLYFSSTF